MATSVTIPGGATGSGAPTISVPFTSAANAAAAQAALSALVPAINAGFETLYPVVAGNQTPPSPSFAGLIADTIPGSAQVGVVSSPFNAIVNAGSGVLTAAATGAGAWTVVSGASSQLVMLNANLGSTPTDVFLGGGFNAIAQAPYAAFAGEQAVVNVDGTGTSTTNAATGGAVIVAPLGSTTVNLFPGAIIDVVSVGATAKVVVNAAGGGANVFEAVQVDGGAGSSVVSVTGAASVGLTYIETSGSGSVNPNGGKLTVSGSAGGSVTVAASTGVVNAIGVTGVVYGGSTGGNSLSLSTVSGSALYSGGNTDFLQLGGAGQAASVGAGTNVTVFGAPGSGGDFIFAGSGSGFLQGGSTGGNTFDLNTGTYSIFGSHGTGASSGNTFVDVPSVGGGTYLIEDFAAQKYGLAYHDQVVLGSGTSITGIASLAGTGGGTSSLVTLSDNTKLTFLNVAPTTLTNGGTIIS